MSNDSWITGTVVRGSGLGKILGFPTANLLLDASAERPPDGIYACWVKIGEERAAHQDGRPLRLGDEARASPTKWAGALHAGPRPAIHDETPTIEFHILDFDGRDLYGQHISLQLVKRLRDVKSFESHEGLKKAITKDCEDARRILSV